MQDSIEKVVHLSAPLKRVWRALTDYREFGAWFRVEIDGPFVVGEVAKGRTTFPGYEGMKWEVTIVAMEPERLFIYEWCPYENDDNREFSTAPKTRVEFRLEPMPTGTRLVITESGFSKLPDDLRRVDAMRTNAKGWDIQAESFAAYVQA